VITQQGQVLKLKTKGGDGKPLWAYRYRVDGRGSPRPQVGGFASQGEALQALKIALEQLHRRNGRSAQITLSELVEEYLAQHEAAPRTIAKLRWLLAKATRAFGDRRVVELRSDEIGAWRTTLSEGHRFEATQALRQVLNRAVAWRILDSNPARAGVDNPTTSGKAPVRVVDGDRRARRATRPWLRAADRVRGRDRLAARRMDRARAPRHRPRRQDPLRTQGVRARATEEPQDASEHARGAAAVDRAGGAGPVADAKGDAARVSGAARRLPRPAQLQPARVESRTALAAEIHPLRRPYDLRHTFATFALRPASPPSTSPASWARASR
jgi:hypothetical protein